MARLNPVQTATRPALPAIEVNKVLKNTYGLLALTLLFSGLTAGLSMAMNWPHPGLVITLVGYFGLLFLTTRFRNSALGLVLVFGSLAFLVISNHPLNTFVASYVLVVLCPPESFYALD